MKTIKIEMNSAAYQDVLRIRRAVFVVEQNIPESLEIDETEEKAIYFLTYLDGKPVTTGRLREYKHYIKFERVATLKEMRGKGTATDLMITMLQYAKAHYPGKTPYMHAQEASVTFYEKLGWRHLGDPFFEAGIPHQAMIQEN